MKLKVTKSDVLYALRVFTAQWCVITLNFAYVIFVFWVASASRYALFFHHLIPALCLFAFALTPLFVCNWNGFWLERIPFLSPSQKETDHD